MKKKKIYFLIFWIVLIKFFFETVVLPYCGAMLVPEYKGQIFDKIIICRVQLISLHCLLASQHYSAIFNYSHRSHIFLVWFGLLHMQNYHLAWPQDRQFHPNMWHLVLQACKCCHHETPSIGHYYMLLWTLSRTFHNSTRNLQHTQYPNTSPIFLQGITHSVT